MLYGYIVHECQGPEELAGGRDTHGIELTVIVHSKSYKLEVLLSL